MRKPGRVKSGLIIRQRALLALGLAVSSALMQSGCGDVQIRESKVESTLPTSVAPIVVGETDRTAVRRLLGQPWLQSEAWRFDLFRVVDRTTAVAVLIVPVWVGSDNVNGYVLVSYDGRGIVSARSAAFVEGDNVSGRSIVASSETSSALVNAGDVTFAVDAFEQTPWVYVAAPRRNEFLEQARRSDNQCLLVIGCLSGSCEAGIAVDDGPPRPLPGAYAGYRPTERGGTEIWHQLWVAPIALQPGAHRIVAVPPKMTTLEAAADLSCAAGDVVFATVDVRRAEGIRWKRSLEGEIRISKVMPESLLDRPLVIWRDGVWLVPAEPGR